MDDRSHPGYGGEERDEARGRDAAPVPRITIHAFWETPESAAAIEGAAKDRLMSRARVALHEGGIARAVQFYGTADTPNLIIVESRSAGDALLDELERLSEVCDPGAKVMVIGHTNDIGLYREVVARGVSEYILAPVDPGIVVASISRIHSDQASCKLGRVYAFIGAKGGVGSSTIAHNAAWAIAHHMDSDVILADMDLPFGTAGLDFNREAAQGLADVIQYASQLDPALLDRLITKRNERLSLLSAPLLLDRSYDLEESTFEPMLEVAQSHVPFTILDVPHLWAGWAKKALLRADQIVITAEPDLANLRNAKNLISFLMQARPNDPAPKLVLNRVGVPKRPEIKPGDFADGLQTQPIACIPFEPHLFGAAANNGQMIEELSGGARLAKLFLDVARTITGRSEVQPDRKGLGPLLQKLVRKRQPG